MSFDVGINVIETDGRAAPAIQAAPTSVAAFLGSTTRGVPNRPVRITNPAQFRTRFGAHRADSYLAYAVEGFFLNGGREAYVSRVVGANSTAATTTLNDRQNTPQAALRVTAGFRGEPDPGEWGTRIRLDVRDDPLGNAALTADVASGATSLVISALVGFQVGSVVRITDGSNTFYRRLTAVDAATRTIRWATSAPVGAALAAATTQVTTAEFRLIVRYQASATEDFAVVEDWRNLSMESDSATYALTKINHPFIGSTYIVLSDQSGATASGIENPALLSSRALSGGVANATTAGDFAGTAANKSGLHAFDTLLIQLLAIPDAHSFSGTGAETARDAVVRAALDYCAARSDCTFVGAAPDRGAPAGLIPRALSDYTEPASNYLTTIKEYAARFHGRKVFGALYGAWLRVNDPIGAGPAPTRFIPPDGHVMGIYARIEQARGIWKAPAGSEADVRGALSVNVDFTDREHTDLVRNGLVNGIRREAGVGIVLATSRTLSTDTRWWFVNIRLLFNFVKVSLRDGLRFVRQEPHTEELRRSVRLNVVTPFLLTLWRQGAFGSGDPADLFTVKCDSENNPPSEVEQGNFHLEAYFYPVRPVETIIVTVGQQASGGALAGEA